MLYFLTGTKQCGKTSWLKGLIDEAAKIGGAQFIDGIITPAVFEGDEKVGIDVMLLPSQETLPLARIPEECRASGIVDGGTRVEKSGKRMKWQFDEGVVAQVNEHLSHITKENPSLGLLMIDEIGWLEFVDGSGYTEAMRILDERCYDEAIVVVRPELIDQAIERWALDVPYIINTELDPRGFLM